MAQKNTTINSALESMIGSFMPMDDPIVSLLTRLLTSGTGLMGTVWNAPGTPNSMYLSSIDEHLKELNRTASDRGKDLVLSQAANVAFRTMYPTEPASFIDSKVQGLLGTGFQAAAWRVGGTLLNFGEMNQIGEGLGAVATNIAKAGLGRGSWSGFRLGNEVAEGLFKEALGGDGSSTAHPYSSKDWFGFSQAGVSTLAGLLTSRLDITNGLDGSGPDAVKTGVTKLKSVVKRYAEALSPLQDVFGNDMQSIVTTLEKLSGSSITGIGSGTLSYLATGLSTRIASGEYNLSGEMGYMNMNSVMHGMLARTTGLSPYMYRAGGTLAMAAGDMIGGTGDNAPSYLTKSQWTAGSRDYAFSSGTATGADALSKIYVLGLKRRKPLWNNEEEFNQRLQKMTARGQDAISAGMQLVGAVSITDLDSAMRYTEYQESVEQGVGARSDMLHRADRTVEMGVGAARVDPNFKSAVGAGNDDFAASSRYRALIGLVKEDPSLLSLAGDDRKSRLEELHAKNLSLFAGMNVEQAMEGLQYAQSSNTHMRTGLTVANLMAGAADVREKAALAAKRQKASDLFVASVSEDWQTLFGTEGITEATITALKNKHTGLSAAMGSLDKEGRITNVMNAMSMLAKAYDDPSINKGLGKAIGFASKGESFTGEFQLAYEDYVRAERARKKYANALTDTDMDKFDDAVRRSASAANRMVLSAGLLSEDGYHRLMSMNFYDKKGNKLTGSELFFARNRFMELLVEKQDGASFELQSKYLESSVYDNGSDQLSTLLSSLRSQFKDSENEDGLSQVGYFRQYIKDHRKDLNKKHGEGVVNQLERMVRDATALGTGEKVTEMTEFIRVLEELKPILKSIAQGLPAKPELNSSSK